MSNVIFDEILGKLRSAEVSGGTGGTSYVGGDRINIAGGTISFVNSADIVNVTGTSVTLQPDTAYKIYATSQAITLNANPPAAGKWAYEGHLEIFTAGTGYIVTGTNVVLANALEPDAVNNCTVRFHDGIAIVSVEDHVAGYVVTVNAASGAGSLAYGLTTASNEYIAVDASLNGSTLDMAGAVTNGEKHIVGNGYSETVLTGGVSCTSNTTFANLSMDGVSVLDGTMTLGDVYIPSGATVSVSGGGLAVEKVRGDGGTIDLGGTSIIVSAYSTVSIGGCIITGGTQGFNITSSTLTLTSCIVSGNTNTNAAAGVIAGYGASVYIHDSVISGNTGKFGTGDDMRLGDSCGAFVRNATVNRVFLAGQNSFLDIQGTCSFGDVIGTSDTASALIHSGAVLDLTGNTNTIPINPAGGVTFAPGGATVYPSAGSASAYMLGGMTVPRIGNTNVVDLSSTCVVISSGGTAYASGCTFSGGSNVTSTIGGAFYLSATASASFVSCNFTGNSAGAGGGCVGAQGGRVTLSGCSFSDTNYAGQVGRDLYISGTSATAHLEGGNQNVSAWVTNNATAYMDGSNSIKRIIGDGFLVISGGAVVDFTGNAIGTPLTLSSGITVETGGCSVITSGGTTVSIAAGNYTKINNDGTTE